MAGAAARAALTRRARPLTAAALVRFGPWLVLAPHPDDESLGAGALLAATGASARLAILTDGARSHVGAPGWSERRIAALRRSEGGQAARTLGLRHPPLPLGWPDARPHLPGSAGWQRAVRMLGTLCRRARIRALAVCWPGERHCDHAAAARLAADVVAEAQGRVRLFHYLVWGWTDPALLAEVRRARALSFAADRPRVRQAVRCHRSQRGGRIAGATERFALPAPILALADAPRGLLLEAADAT